MVRDSYFNCCSSAFNSFYPVISSPLLISVIESLITQRELLAAVNVKSLNQRKNQSSNRMYREARGIFLGDQIWITY